MSVREPEKFVQVGARIPKGHPDGRSSGNRQDAVGWAVAGEAGVPFFHISGSEFVEMFVGVGASRVVTCLRRRSRLLHPSSLWMKLTPSAVQRGAGMGGGHDGEQTLSQILVEMDGFDNDTNVIVIAATNRADILDPALLRPGRFDRKVFVDLPDVAGREDRAGSCSRQTDCQRRQLQEISRLTAGFPGLTLRTL
ncbi:MAG: AAA family ATPase [Chloroflexota bacterium]